ncbi:hypothetical protein K493DRAFT_387457 [Basidiobolus meristosporus CBS 931.73]|uniref:Uncharacterized protein n=1 Tax=Basidiobolus meristosporus CBS 931.73 TaxID=1314790 RepID=A0A1Y1YVP2_9FUNG|nr:hypothetical protein K493DRAFT_387457 [Basidiobolus meristosporus CBS 931.73]|eukprot:ORY02122.1 hypothetical protein K493DRAFT_387457 [Basidiobolus meristosporus CBS 931.73]
MYQFWFDSPKLTLGYWRRKAADVMKTNKWSLLRFEEGNEPPVNSYRPSRRYLRFLCSLMFFLCCMLVLFFLVRLQIPQETWIRPLYNSSDVQVLRESYPPHNYTLETPSITFMLTKCTAGFGSYINDAFSAFLFALDNNVAFHIQSREWCHVSWSTFFYDYSQDTHAPIVLDTYSPGAERWHEASGTPKDIQEPGFNGHVFVVHSGENFDDFYHQIATIKQPVYARKKVVAQALWEPKPVIMDVVNSIRKHYVEDSNRILISMHIHRKDKLRREIKKVETSVFVEKLQELSSTKYPNREIALFVLGDDDDALLELRSLLAHHHNIEVFGLSDAFTHLPRSTTSWSPLEQHQGYKPADFQVTSEKHQFQQTAELITDITLAATAEEFICCYSSNIARLVSLLRTQSQDTIHSLDWEAWTNE